MSSRSVSDSPDIQTRAEGEREFVYQIQIGCESTGEIASSINNESTANRKQSDLDEILVAISLIYIRNKRGPSTPWNPSFNIFPFRTSSFDYNTLLPSS